MRAFKVLVPAPTPWLPAGPLPLIIWSTSAIAVSSSSSSF